MTNEKSIYGHENNFPTINSCQFIHRTWGGVWVVTAISSYNNYEGLKRRWSGSDFPLELDRGERGRALMLLCLLKKCIKIQ